MTSEPPARPSQLQMIWPVAAGRRIRAPRLAKPYRLRTWRPGDDQAVVEVLRSAGFDQWSMDLFRQTIAVTLPDGLFVVEHEATGQVVCCTWAEHRATDRYRFGGELGWVGCRPEHRGHRLSAVTCVAVVRRLLAAGYRCIYLQTDDSRLPAIKTYLRLGWVPYFVEGVEGYADRWRAVCEQLNWPFEPEAWARDVAAARAMW